MSALALLKRFGGMTSSVRGQPVRTMLDAIADIPSETPSNWYYQAVLETSSWSFVRWPKTLALSNNTPKETWIYRVP